MPSLPLLGKDPECVWLLEDEGGREVVAWCQPGFPDQGCRVGTSSLGGGPVRREVLAHTREDEAPFLRALSASTPFLPFSLLQPPDSAFRPHCHWRGRRGLKGAPLTSWPHFVGAGRPGSCPGRPALGEGNQSPPKGHLCSLNTY